MADIKQWFPVKFVRTVQEVTFPNPFDPTGASLSTTRRFRNINPNGAIKVAGRPDFVPVTGVYVIKTSSGKRYSIHLHFYNRTGDYFNTAESFAAGYPRVSIGIIMGSDLGTIVPEQVPTPVDPDNVIFWSQTNTSINFVNPGVSATVLNMTEQSAVIEEDTVNDIKYHTWLDNYTRNSGQDLIVENIRFPFYWALRVNGTNGQTYSTLSDVIHTSRRLPLDDPFAINFTPASKSGNYSSIIPRGPAMPDKQFRLVEKIEKIDDPDEPDMVSSTSTTQYIYFP